MKYIFLGLILSMDAYAVIREGGGSTGDGGRD